jgi:hypothetical protein
MRTLPLRTYNVPDLADHVIHFTGRNGWKMDVPPEISAMDGEQRLLQILMDHRIRGFDTFGSSAPVVCLTESTQAAVTTLIRDGRYSPYGIGFTKQFVFERSGGPALYVRGDEWLNATSLPQPLRCRLVRFWPGSVPDPGEFPWVDAHLRQSEWLHEREWRVPTELPLAWEDVRFLIVSDPNWQAANANVIEDWAGREYGNLFRSIPAVVIGANGAVIEDRAGLWSP